MTADTEPDSLHRKGHLEGASESLLQSLASRLRRLRVSLFDPEAARLEKIRGEMLQALATCGETGHPKLADRIRFATDLESLWYLRTELLAAVTECVGADAAGRSLGSITSQFIGVLPIATTTRTHRRK
jgi:hypothetical protein